MGKTIQIRFSKEDIEEAVKKYINMRIKQVCDQQGVDGEIAFEVEQSVVEVRLVGYDERIKKLEEKVYGGG